MSLFLSGLVVIKKWPEKRANITDLVVQNNPQAKTKKNQQVESFWVSPVCVFMAFYCCCYLVLIVFPLPALVCLVKQTAPDHGFHFIVSFENNIIILIVSVSGLTFDTPTADSAVSIKAAGN